MKILAFKIVNELLNQGLIIEDVSPSQLEVIVLHVLESNLDLTIGKKIHFEKRIFFDADLDGALCGYHGKEITLTTKETEVTCKSCLCCLRVRNEGRGYTVRRNGDT